MGYRIDDLAARCGVTVDTVRFYQSKRLLPPPEREGRVAFYSDEHVDRLHQIRHWKARGLTLAVIRALVSGELGRADEALVAALAEPLPTEAGATERSLTFDELAAETGISRTLLEAISREGLLVPRPSTNDAPYTSADVAAVNAGLTLLDAGLPLSELLALAREHDDAMRRIASRAVELFLRFVRDPIRASTDDETLVADRMVAAFRDMLPAVTALVGHHFQRVLLAAAMQRIESEGKEAEIEAVRTESRRTTAPL